MLAGDRQLVLELTCGFPELLLGEILLLGLTDLDVQVQGSKKWGLGNRALCFVIDLVKLYSVDTVFLFC